MGKDTTKVHVPQCTSAVRPLAENQELVIKPAYVSAYDHDGQSMIDFKGIFKRKDDQEVVEELFEFTKNPTDWIASQQVEEMIQAKDINFSIMRFGNFATKRSRGMIGSLRDRTKYNGSRVWSQSTGRS